MAQLWLHPNRQLYRIGLMCSLMAVIVGSITIWRHFRSEESGSWVFILGTVILVAGLILSILIYVQSRRPRIAYQDGQVLFYLRAGAPVQTPIEVVEAFFLGQGPAELPGKAAQTETVNLIARIGERAVEWQRVDVRRELGSWCDGYVTIRGTHCEPLNEDLVRRLNHQLAEAKRALKTKQNEL